MAARKPKAPPVTEWSEDGLHRLRILTSGLEDMKQEIYRTNNRLERAGITASKDNDPFMHDLLLDPLVSAKNIYTDQLEEQYKRTVPDKVRAWASETPGCASGPWFPRFLGFLGHPRWATPYKWHYPEDGGKRILVPDGDPYPRTLRELYAICGCGDPERAPWKGAGPPSETTQADLLARGKRSVLRPLLFMFSTGLVKMATPGTDPEKPSYGVPRSENAAESKLWQVFEHAKKDGEGKTHQWECHNKKRPPMMPNGCGIVEHREWGEIGSPWRPGHILMHAHRMAQKAFLDQLYDVSG